MSENTCVISVCEKCSHPTRKTDLTFETPKGLTDKSRVKTGKLISEMWSCSNCDNAGMKFYSTKKSDNSQ